MASFLKVLFRNLLEGPSTDPFPVGETFTPDRLRGKCVVDPELCMGCGICKNSCAAGAIDISPKEDKSGFTITVWRDSCCMCASCRHYCPTGAMSITNDWHHTHEDKDKYDIVERKTINYEPCAHCGAMIRPMPLKLAEKLYAKNDEIDAEVIRHLCPKCRQLEDARRIEQKPAIVKGKDDSPEASAAASQEAKTPSNSDAAPGASPEPGQTVEQKEKEPA